VKHFVFIHLNYFSMPLNAQNKKTLIKAMIIVIKAMNYQTKRVDKLFLL